MKTIVNKTRFFTIRQKPIIDRLPVNGLSKLFFKALTILILILAFSDTVKAQRRFFHRRYFGVYTGANFSGFSGDYQSTIPGNSGKIRLRTQYGIYANFYIQRHFSIYSAAEIDLNGALTKGEELSATETVSYVAKTNLTTLSVPVLLNFTPRVEWGFMIGPELNYIISAKEPWYKSDFVKPPDYQEDVNFKFNDLTVGLAVAVNYLLLNGVTFQVRYTNSIMSIVKEEYGNARSYSILFFVGFNLLHNVNNSKLTRGASR